MSDDSELSHNFIFKVCAIGDGEVGKTSLINRFTEGRFNKDYIKTVGAQFSRYEKIEGDIKSRLFFWDIAGQQEFSFMRPTFYNGAKAAVLVYSLINDETLEHLPEWVDDIRKYCGDDLPLVCFANKADLVEGKDVDNSKIEAILKEKNISKIYYTSAKTGENVKDAFDYIIDLLVKQGLAESK